jgi:putative methionine-R-sulfoxide reductase with GAF domain
VQPVKSVIRDSGKNIWIATEGEGILKCTFGKDNSLAIVKQFTKADGLNSLHYLSLLADNENNIWAASSIGLTLIGQHGNYRDKIVNFDQADGFTSPGYNSITLYQESDNTIWAGTTFGFISFKPDTAFLSSAAPRVSITGIKQIKKNAFVMEKTSFSRYSYNNNSFNFSFSALDYANQNGLQYFYKLEGLDSNWISAGNLRSVTYENLTPRSYTFRVKALNNKGKWSKNDAFWSFGINAPFWKQSWFILLSAGAVIALLFILIRSREAKQAKLQKQKAAGYREQLEIEQIINHFATSMNSISNTDDLLWDVAKNCISKLNFEDCVIYLKDEDRNVLIQKAAFGPKTSKESLTNGHSDKINAPVTIPVGKGITGHVALMGKAEIVGDTSLDERYIVDDDRRFSEIAVPIIANETVIGVIDSEH